ncbi:MAG: rod shape-determining protein MreC [Calditrichaeota bacterium]|nr:rod shape-determining protein MreC [Calditrichota bacterium]RQW07674.1 MAG: rod shape-determining protein MreC [Calditrichota bacterium]
MKKVFGIFSQRRTVFLLGFYVVFSLFLMTLNDPYQLRGIRIAVLQTMSWMHQIRDHVNLVKNLKEENQQLRKKLLEKSLENQQMQESMLENIRLHRMLKFKEESNYSLIAAKVIGYGQEPTIRSLILDVGSADSVEKNQPVITDLGLVGKSLVVEKNQSIVQILMDRNSLVSARLQKSREVGVVGWSGNLWLDLNYISREVVVEPGEVVLTSGLSRIYPAGIKIGIVAEVRENEYELFKQIKIKPAVDFDRLEEVFVIKTPDSLKSREGID